MKLYTCRGAPHPMRVQLYLAEKAAAGHAIPLEVIEVDLRSGEHRQAPHLARNRAGQVPVLEVGDEVHLVESLAIIEYLEECFPQPPLWGATPLERARQRALDRIAELRVLRPMGLWVHATNSPLGLKPDPAVARTQAATVGSGLAQVDAALRGGRPWLAGASCGVADCTLAAGLDFGFTRGFALPAEASALQEWRDRFWARHGASGFLRWRKE
jgi:glutathione S-transferase